MVPQRLHDRAKAGLLAPQCPVVESHTRRYHVWRPDATPSQELSFLSWYALRGGRCPARAFKGMNGAPTSCSKRSSVTEHGMAYRARAPWSRRANSTRESRVSPGRTGKPCTGGSGPGGWMPRTCEVREMRNAAAGLVIMRAILARDHWRAV